MYVLKLCLVLSSFTVWNALEKLKTYNLKCIDSVKVPSSKEHNICGPTTTNPLRHYYKRRPTTGVLPMIAENRNSCETGKKFLRFYISRLLVHSLTVHSPSFVQKSCWIFTNQMNLRKHSSVEGLVVLVCHSVQKLRVIFDKLLRTFDCFLSLYNIHAYKKRL